MLQRCAKVKERRIYAKFASSTHLMKKTNVCIRYSLTRVHSQKILEFSCNVQRCYLIEFPKFCISLAWEAYTWLLFIIISYSFFRADRVAYDIYCQNIIPFSTYQGSLAPRGQLQKPICKEKRRAVSNLSHTNAFIKIFGVFVSTKTKQNSFIVHFTCPRYSIFIAKRRNTKTPKTLMEMTVYDAFFGTVFTYPH